MPFKKTKLPFVFIFSFVSSATICTPLIFFTARINFFASGIINRTTFDKPQKIHVF